MAAAGRKAGTVAEAKILFLEQLQSGMTIKAATNATGRNITTYERWRRDDPEFVSAVERIRNMRNVSGVRTVFTCRSRSLVKVSWCPRFPHMQNVGI